MLSCLLNNQRINCIDGQHTRDQLKTWAKKKILLCPACGKPYEYCHGQVKMPYFRHMDKIECEDKYSEPETEEHLAGKKDLYEWLKKQPGITDCELEGWIPGTKQRPDIMFKFNGQQYVLEYQCSPIATEYLERHELYQVAGIKDIWIAGYEKYFKKNSRHKFLENYVNGYYNPIDKKFYLNNWEQEDVIYMFGKIANRYRNDNYLNNFIFQNGEILFYYFKKQNYRLAPEKHYNRKNIKESIKKSDRTKFIKKIEFIKKNFNKYFVTVHYPNYWDRDLFVRFNRNSNNTIKFEDHEHIYLKINNFIRVEEINKKLKHYNKKTSTWSFYLFPNTNVLQVDIYDNRGYHLHGEERYLMQAELIDIQKEKIKLEDILLEIMIKCKDYVIKSRNNYWKVINNGG